MGHDWQTQMAGVAVNDVGGAGWGAGGGRAQSGEAEALEPSPMATQRLFLAN